MIHGTYSARVIDAPKLVIGLLGLGHHQGSQFMNWFRDLVMKTIKDDIAELCVKKKWPLVDVASGAYTEEIEAEALVGVRTHVESYGLEVARFGNFHIAIDSEDEERLNKFYEKASYINMSGGMQGYQQFAQAEMMMNAGEGMAKGGGDGGGGGALAGAGLGMGLGMANQMMNQNQQQANVPTNTPATGGAPPPLPGQGGIAFFAGINGAQVGPLDEATLSQKIAAGEITAETLVWRQGMAQWTAAGQVPEVAKLFQTPPPLP